SCAISRCARTASGWFATSGARVAPRRAAGIGGRLALFVVLSLALGAPIAAELGRASVRSRLGQPMDVDIEVRGLKPGEDKTLAARLAPRQAHRKAGIEYNRVLSELRLSIVRRGGRPVVRMRTTQAVNEPYVEALIEL